MSVFVAMIAIKKKSTLFILTHCDQYVLSLCYQLFVLNVCFVHDYIILARKLYDSFNSNIKTFF